MVRRINVPKPKTIKLVHIGDRFYRDSYTAMSSLYTEDGIRFDYGFVQIELAKGNNVTIRQATPKELIKYEKFLAKCRKR